ncbi:MAG: hypothetical protein Q9P01_03555 [Anaerolineae bacterium]|nr:hypothetical protein [Anaerolineae bacterium]MDQ7033926.1 hypothetical protein [Anaerolineae bacterium]
MAEDRRFQSSYMEGVSKFQGLRTKAFLQEMMSLLRGQSAELLSFDEVRARLRLRAESYKGLQDIPVDKIIGSVGRHRDFTQTFLPKSDDARDRWSRVYAKVNSLEGVPPIEVYQVDDVYFVRDGNHRVSVAREINAKTIEAHVTELPTEIDLEPGMTLADLDAAGAYVAFLEETQLKYTRPHHQSIQLSDPSGYAELLAHIYLHGQVMEQIRGEAVKMPDAAADWYDNIYRPALTLIRKHNVLQLTGEEKKYTEADVYVWMVEHLRDIRRQYGDRTDTRKFSHALVDYLTEKKIAIPRELVNEDDESVILSRTQVMKALREEKHRHDQDE